MAIVLSDEGRACVQTIFRLATRFVDRISDLPMRFTADRRFSTDQNVSWLLEEFDLLTRWQADFHHLSGPLATINGNQPVGYGDQRATSFAELSFAIARGRQLNMQRAVGLGHGNAGTFRRLHRSDARRNVAMIFRALDQQSEERLNTIILRRDLRREFDLLVAAAGPDPAGQTGEKKSAECDDEGAANATSKSRRSGGRPRTRDAEREIYRDLRTINGASKETDDKAFKSYLKKYAHLGQKRMTRRRFLELARELDRELSAAMETA